MDTSRSLLRPLRIAVLGLLLSAFSASALAVSHSLTASSFSPTDKVVATNSNVTINNSLSIGGSGSGVLQFDEGWSGGPIISVITAPTCSGGSTSSVTLANASPKTRFTASLTGSAGTCTYSVGVSSSTRGSFSGGNYSSTIVGGSSGGGTWTPSSLSAETFHFIDRPTVNITAPTTLQVGSAGTVTVKLGNPNNSFAEFQNGSLSITLSSGLVVGTGSASTTCPSGSVSASPGSQSVSVSGGFTIPNGNCDVTFPIAATATGSQSVNVAQTGLSAKGYIQASGPLSSTLFNPASSTSASVLVPTVPGLSTATLPEIMVGTPYSASVSATGTPPISYSASGLPAGLTLSDSGVISGTPMAVGVFTVNITATSPYGSTTKAYSLTVLPPPPITTTGNGSSGGAGSGNSGSSGSSSATGPTANPNQPLPPAPIFQTTYLVSDGRLPEQAVTVSIAGTYGNATINVTLDLGQVLNNSFAAGYNVYLAAQVPGARLGLYEPTWFMKPPARDWETLGFPLTAFLENVANGSVEERRVITLVANTDLSRLIGTEFYLGYGLSSEEMLASKRYRGIYKVNAP